MRISRRVWVSLAVLAAFAIVPPLLTRVAPALFTDLRALILGVGASYALMAISLNLLTGYAGQISLGHGALLGVGALTSGILTGRQGLPFIVALVAAGVMGGIVAFIVGIPALRLRGLYLAVATIAFGFMMEQSVFRWQPISRGSGGLELPRPLAGTFLFAENGDYLAIILVVLLGVWLVDANVVRTKLGRAFQGIREDEAVAQSFGVDVARYKLLAFVLSGAIAGMAGSVYGHLIGFVSAESFPYNFSLLLLVMVVVGGLGSRVGVVIAAVAYGVFPRLLLFLRGWDLIVGALLLIYTVARHPGGMAQAIREAREAKSVREARRATGDSPDELENAMPKLPDLPRPSGLPERPHEAAGRALLDVHEVSVRFGGLQAVDGASLEVRRGQIVGLIGPNGAGKTTLFNAISGFIRPQAGRIHFEGQPVHDLPPHERARLGMGRTFQLVGLAKNLSVLENFLLAQHTVGAYSAPEALLYLPRTTKVERELRDRARAAVEALGFEQYLDTPVKNLSLGQQRIVELGCALVTAPELLLLDEPSAGMSPAAAENLAERLRDIRDELGRTVLIIEHHIPLVLAICDYVYVLNFGQVLAHGTTAEIARQPEVISAYFGEAVG